MFDQKSGKFSSEMCKFCQCLIDDIERVQGFYCEQCKNDNLVICFDCIIGGNESKNYPDHLRTHKMVSLPMFYNDMQKHKEEVENFNLVQMVQKFKTGNWKFIGEKLGLINNDTTTKKKLEIAETLEKKFYDIFQQYFVKKKQEQKPFDCNQASIYEQRRDFYAQQDILSEVYKILEVDNQDDLQQKLKSLPGYMPLRNEFDDEYLNWAEYYFQNQNYEQNAELCQRVYDTYNKQLEARYIMKNYLQNYDSKNLLGTIHQPKPHLQNILKIKDIEKFLPEKKLVKLNKYIQELDQLFDLFSFVDTITENTDDNENELGSVIECFRKQFNFNLKIDEPVALLENFQKPKSNSLQFSLIKFLQETGFADKEELNTLSQEEFISIIQNHIEQQNKSENSV